MTFREAEKEIEKRNLPSLFKMKDGSPVTPEKASERRTEMLEMLSEYVFGKMPERNDIRFEVLKTDGQRCCAGKAVDKTVAITILCEVPFTFTVRIHRPKKAEKVPFVIFPNFRKFVPDEYLPAEELIDRGVGFATFCYKEDISSDADDFSDGFAACFYPDGKRQTPDDCGKIALWAYACMRTLDYVLENENADETHIAVAGHSRLGKTALLTAACDTRFTHAYSNDSGCSGASLSRENKGETIADITRVFPYWFCPRYAEYAGRADALPLDQHFLLASIAPRHVMVGSAVEDKWADPDSEYLSCVAAGKFWELYGKKAFPEKDCPETDGVITGQNIAYHRRSGVHFMSRTDWNRFLDFFLQ